MDLSVVIADAYDLRIKRCIESIDEDVEVVVSLNGPTNELVGLVSTLGVSTCLLPQRGLGAALNNGIDHARFDKILIIDSDCVFERGTIRKLYRALDSSLMVRGIQQTRWNSYLSKLTSIGREWHGNTNPDPNVDEVRAYKPLGYRRETIKRLGGMMYNPLLKLSEDFEMNERRKQAGVGLVLIPDAVIYHDRVSVGSDLKSAYRYGQDRQTMVECGLTRPKKHFIQSWQKIKDRCLPRYGLSVAAYMVLWTAAYDCGYHIQKLSGRNRTE